MQASGMMTRSGTVVGPHATDETERAGAPFGNGQTAASAAAALRTQRETPVPIAQRQAGATRSLQPVPITSLSLRSHLADPSGPSASSAGKVGSEKQKEDLLAESFRSVRRTFLNPGATFDELRSAKQKAYALNEFVQRNPGRHATHEPYRLSAAAMSILEARVDTEGGTPALVLSEYQASLVAESNSFIERAKDVKNPTEHDLITLLSELYHLEKDWSLQPVALQIRSSSIRYLEFPLIKEKLILQLAKYHISDYPDSVKIRLQDLKGELNSQIEKYENNPIYMTYQVSDKDYNDLLRKSFTCLSQVDDDENDVDIKSMEEVSDLMSQIILLRNIDRVPDSKVSIMPRDKPSDDELRRFDHAWRGVVAEIHANLLTSECGLSSLGTAVEHADNLLLHASSLFGSAALSTVNDRYGLSVETSRLLGRRIINLKNKCYDNKIQAKLREEAGRMFRGSLALVGEKMSGLIAFGIELDDLITRYAVQSPEWTKWNEPLACMYLVPVSRTVTYEIGRRKLDGFKKPDDTAELGDPSKWSERFEVMKHHFVSCGKHMSLKEFDDLILETLRLAFIASPKRDRSYDLLPWERRLRSECKEDEEARQVFSLFNFLGTLTVKREKASKSVPAMSHEQAKQKLLEQEEQEAQRQLEVSAKRKAKSERARARRAAEVEHARTLDRERLQAEQDRLRAAEEQRAAQRAAQRRVAEERRAADQQRVAWRAARKEAAEHARAQQRLRAEQRRLQAKAEREAFQVAEERRLAQTREAARLAALQHEAERLAVRQGVAAEVAALRGAGEPVAWRDQSAVERLVALTNGLDLADGPPPGLLPEPRLFDIRFPQALEATRVAANPERRRPGLPRRTVSF